MEDSRWWTDRVVDVQVLGVVAHFSDGLVQEFGVDKRGREVVGVDVRKEEGRGDEKRRWGKEEIQI